MTTPARRNCSNHLASKPSFVPQRDPWAPKSHGALCTQGHILRLPVSLTPPQFTEGPVVASDELNLSSALLRPSPPGGKTRETQICGSPSALICCETPGQRWSCYRAPWGTTPLPLGSPLLFLPFPLPSQGPDTGHERPHEETQHTRSWYARGAHGSLGFVGTWSLYDLVEPLGEKETNHKHEFGCQRAYLFRMGREITGNYGPRTSLLPVTTDQKRLHRNGRQPVMLAPRGHSASQQVH